jgi:2-polyprenyl-3-methyl-5-hydroxy-6-metoxy-1,4-benzoquinol methylase
MYSEGVFKMIDDSKKLNKYWNSVTTLSPGRLEAKSRVLNAIQSGYVFETRACICGSLDNESVINKDVMGIPTFVVVCRKCGLLFQSSRLDKASLNSFYKDFYTALYSSDRVDEQQEFTDMYGRGRLIYEYISKKVPSFFTQQKSVLEVGCNKGAILLFFSQNGHDVTGIDLNPEAIAFGQRNNINVHLMDIDTFVESNSDAKFDLIIYNHVLEHISDTNAESDNIKKLLNDNGYLYIGVPSLICGLRQNFLHLQKHIIFDHIYYFNRDTLQNSMKVLGFKEISCDDSPLLDSGQGVHFFSIYQNGVDEADFKNAYYETIALLNYANSSIIKRIYCIYCFCRKVLMHYMFTVLGKPKKNKETERL